jgi:fructose-1,6-bisphosphatase/inositol monophosphatase family enzyme
LVIATLKRVRKIDLTPRHKGHQVIAEPNISKHMHALSPAVEALMRRVAADVVLPRYQQLAAHEIEEKTPGELVTVVDRESERG